MKKPFTSVTVVVLALIALAHAMRIILGWKFTIAGAHGWAWSSGGTLVLRS
jgi:hypothetical protein